MSQDGVPGGRGVWLLLGSLVLGLGTVGAAVAGYCCWRPTKSMYDAIPRAIVHRTDLQTMVTASGSVESATNSLIVCELENLQVGSQGRSVAAGGSSTILSLIPDGTSVKKDDVLCRLDSSAYEEMVRLQEMLVQTAGFDKRQAELNLQSAKLAVLEYEEGQRAQTLEEMEGRIVMAKSELEKATSRLEWADRMAGRKYISPAQHVNERIAKQRAEQTLKEAMTARRTFVRYNADSTTHALGKDVDIAKTLYDFQASRYDRLESQLNRFRRQVDRCTLRAPHDGYVIYAKGPGTAGKIQEGDTVRQKQVLFRLPDLAKMEVFADLHESIVDRVQKGMRVRVRIEAIASRIIEGRVMSIAMLPVVDRNSWMGLQIKNYRGRIQLDSSPAGIRPGMSAEIEILTAQRPNTLVVPSEAVAVQDGHEYCYVAGNGKVERREVEVGQSNEEMLEVTEGLAEGELVLLEPSLVDAEDSDVLDTPSFHRPKDDETPALAH